MTTTEVAAFRQYLKTATTTQLASGNACKAADGTNCHGSGICLPTYNIETRAYNFTCSVRIKGSMLEEERANRLR